MHKFPLEVQALRVEQPMGVYYVAVLPASVLLDVAFSDVLSASLRDGGGSYDLDGTQRLVQPKRLQSIADYINREDAAFPNSIILAANFRKEDGLIEDEDPDFDDEQEYEAKRWSVEEGADGSCTLRIPTSEKLAAIIDGQHRLFAFVNARPQRWEMNLICSIFLDLPKPYQAQLFATINSTQKPVDKSLTYELFGYNLDEEQEQYWSPDKLAVFLARRLGTDEKSPLCGRILVAPKKDEALSRLGDGATWKVSTAVVVEGVMRLFTSNPKKDTTNLLNGERKKRSELLPLRKDKSPLRQAYLESQDAVIYTMTLNFLLACQDIFWKNAQPGSFIIKTVGIQALFDILRLLAADAYQKRDISMRYFSEQLQVAQSIDFSSDAFRNASGSGRSTIKKAIVSAIGLQ
ncbi:DNA phosphorothioation-associated DGQHR protein 1 [Delftia acidovorans]|uniref:DNA phosphorothioation-associated DGQHR protein 1 n=1 Tax=Delftia acidovorans TaxID=80866 RepID=UPI000BC36BF9|nr:DNA phosphorothioation-associated DGQHR protein 1 [Delftia acidovorans]SOE35327.1 DNA phosphorothioation-associated DGQHR protein 1 [Delftia acidovorans]